VLEAGFDPPGRPLVLLLHGFPELAWSWRKVMPALAAAGYRVVAPDQRGFGRTTGWDPAYDGDLASFRPFSLVQDLLSLVFSMDYGFVTAVVGHDFGSPVAAHCALIRPDIFTSVVMMSAPFAGPPPAGPVPAADQDVPAALARLTPPRQHYQWYYSTRQAAADMLRPPQGLHDFLRAYFHVKSGDWPGNHPYPLSAFNAGELARLPDYYVMPAGASMPQAVAPYLPPAAQAAACPWLTEAELGVYCAEFARTGFQGGLQWYRCATSGLAAADLRLFAGRTIAVPAAYIAGEADWGTYQVPGVFESLGRSVPGCAGGIWCPAPGTGSSRSRRRP
jgi:pimeloyl-ACP methyl ester carboxylesterase